MGEEEGMLVCYEELQSETPATARPSISLHATFLITGCFTIALFVGCFCLSRQCGRCRDRRVEDICWCCARCCPKSGYERPVLSRATASRYHDVYEPCVGPGVASQSQRGKDVLEECADEMAHLRP